MSSINSSNDGQKTPIRSRYQSKALCIEEPDYHAITERGMGFTPTEGMPDYCHHLPA
jgi:hypothetical protein